ncbi:MAG: hypothetical protein K8L99_01740 [Anaerolineae bacterium]|nr:hypothetical protein [Anaerolineae bacterium]
MTDKKGPTDPKTTTPPPGTEEDTNWFDEIGPEGEDPRVIEENLEQYGFNQMDEDDFESDPVAPSDQPDWTEEATYGGERPLMPDDPAAPLEDHLHEVDEDELEEE